MVRSADECVVGVDVGTGSVRAGIVSLDGRLLGRGVAPITTWYPHPGHVEQSSDEIWTAVTAAVRAALASSGLRRDDVAGIGFDATCSLVAVDAAGRPVAVNADGDDHCNIVVWMDHRAVDDAAAINATGHQVLDFVGTAISPEMQTPKLRWLRRSLPDQWGRTAHWFDLPDFLTFRATGSLQRSLCSLVCKWTYLGHEGRFSSSYFDAIGLGELASEGFVRIGCEVSPPGTPVPGGLSTYAAAELGLVPGTPVATSIIDAHAGALGLLGAMPDVALDRRLAIIAGTSACHLAVASDERRVPGVWGPYWSALLPNQWLAEAGISASGAAIDRLVADHPAASSLGDDVLEHLEHELASVAGDDWARLTMLAAHVHVDPSLLGNRAPLADPTRRGAIVGLTTDRSTTDLAVRYLATVQGLAYATRHILDAMGDAGWHFDRVAVTGGSATSELWLRTHADVLGVDLVVPAEAEAVIVGAAVLAAVAAGVHPSAAQAMERMVRAGRVIRPDRTTAEYHTAKYGVYRALLDHADEYRRTMARVVPGPAR